MNALDAFRTAVGAEHVLAGAEDVRSAEAATFPVDNRVAAVVRPGDAAEVQACVRVANEHRVPIYPVSRGRNWGLGSRVPARSGCVLLELGRLDRIVDHDERLGTLTVQPGVTFQRVHDFLREKKSRLFAAITGGPPDGSLLGNVLERGEGSGPYGDRASHVCGLEVVLPTGELVRTGFGRFPGAATARLSSFGVGPFLDGLFIQSNLGVVTELTVFLHPRPRYLARFSMVVNDVAALAEVVDAVQPLVLRGVIASHSFGMWSAYKIMAINGRYPWEAMKGETPLRLRDIAGKEPWNTGGALYAASARQRTAGLKLIEAAVKKLPCTFGFALSNGLSDDTDAWVGLPSPRNLRALYWRKKRGPAGFIGAFDPHRDRCGILWLHPTLPFVGAHVARAVEIMRDTTHEHGFEPLMGMSCPSGRLANVYLAIVWDREIDGEDARAMACHDAVMERLVAAGYPPYRLGVQSMRSVPDSGTPYEDVLARVKAALDPNDILAPGRYDFRRNGRPA